MMHRLRTRKKAKEGNAASRRPSDESEVPPLPSAGGKSFRWGKSQQAEPRPEFDLTHALPPTEDFRTSLLMPKMSARFSMLREQDDPNTKIGKANDDSVLFPKRSSRYMEFGPWPSGAKGSTNLADIMEVSSIKGSIRPPFANGNGSSEDIGTDDDSTNGGGVMTRSRGGGDGNTMFGGRQKVYKIPVGSASSKNPSSAGGDQGSGRGMGGGKFLYENDLAMSSFQRLRETQRERGGEMDQKEGGEEAELHLHQIERGDSPPLSGYNKNRETSSSTTSGPSNTRISTAATSVTSQYGGNNSQPSGIPPAMPSPTAVERSATKSRRPLYEQGLDQHLYEQQSHAINKMDILSRQRTVNGGTPQSQSPQLNHAGSASNLNELHLRSMSPTQMSDATGMRAQSPPPVSAPAIGPFNFGIAEPSTDRSMSEDSSPIAGSGRDRHDPPSSRPFNAAEGNGFPNPWPATSSQPDDGGVAAVALSAFARQRKQYDEQQYSQRQLLMHSGREAQSAPRSLPPQVPAPDPPITARMRGDAGATAAGSRSNSLTRRQYQPPTELSPRKTNRSPPSDMYRLRAGEDGAAQSNGTFTFLDFSSPESEDVSTFDHQHPTKPIRRPDGRYNQYFPPQAQRVPLDERPTNLRIPEPHVRPIQEVVSHEDAAIPTINSRDRKVSLPDSVRSSDEEGSDSPTLGPDGGLNLLVRRHLRSDSGLSSVYGGAGGAAAPSFYGASNGGANGVRSSRSGSGPGPGPGPAAGAGKDASTRESRTTQQSVDSSSGNPFEFEDWDGGYFGEAESNSSISPTGPRLANGSVQQPPHSVGSQLHQEQRGAPRKGGDKPATRGGPTKDVGVETHYTTKMANADAQREQDDFANELAQRRKRIQDNLKSYAERERSMSPAPGTSAGTPAMEYIKESPIRAGSPFGIRNPKTNRAPEVSSSKAKKLLGLGVNNVNGSPRAEDDFWKREEERMLYDVVKSPKSPKQSTTTTTSSSSSSSSPSPPPQSTLPAAESVQPPNSKQIDQQQSPPRKEGLRRDEDVPDSSRSRPTPRPSRLSSSSPNSGRERSGSGNSGGTRNGDIKYRDDLQRAMAIGIGSSTSLPEEPPIDRKYNNPSRPASQQQLAHMPGSGPVAPRSGRSRSNSKSTFPGAFDSNDILAFQTTGMPPRPSPSPITPYSANSTPSLYETPITSAAATPTKGTTPGFQSAGRIPSGRKRSVNKADISEPIFLSATSTITTVNLPPGASLKNGSENAPPIPPLNPRRRRLTTTTQTVFGAFSRSEKNDHHAPPVPIAEASLPEERSTFSADEESSRPKPRAKLRKTSSEGGNLNARARHQAMMAPSPAMPTFPAGTPMMSPSPIIPTYANNTNMIPQQQVVEGGMF
ncbi:hypothetical protein GP486_007191 [Trichoglossum hirsutum]|uniref:Uncharacterized protein n=1 Tax=Trichoglossum hirsutum TaxID=265104 RepID=A0A9P8L516_9PEZI|nr:hypothetical protein GP486_007191 [Trichoglossum hirsutum]